MNVWFADDGEMRDDPSERLVDDPVDLDDELIDQVIDATEDVLAPPPYQAVVDILMAAGAPATDAELAGEREAVALFRSNHSTGRPPRESVRQRRVRKRTLLIVTGTVVVATVGGTAAATGNLPDAAQDLASALLSKIGIDVPSSERASVPGPSSSTVGTAEVSSVREAEVAVPLLGLDRSTLAGGGRVEPSSPRADVPEPSESSASPTGSRSRPPAKGDSPRPAGRKSPPDHEPPAADPPPRPTDVPAPGPADPPSGPPGGDPPSPPPPEDPPSPPPSGGPPSAPPGVGPPSAPPGVGPPGVGSP
jgi:hypothetical protein